MATFYTAIQSQERKTKVEKTPPDYGIRHSVEEFALQLRLVTDVCLVM